MNKSKPLYKSITVWVSVLALLFSFGTSYVSFKRVEVQDLQNLKSELRVILQKLSELPVVHFELTHKYKGDEIAIAFLSTQINHENTLLAKQASDIIDRIPKGKITPTEYSSTAAALKGAYQFTDALYYYKLALDSSESANDEVSILKGIANLKFLLGKPEEGRKMYKEALNIFSKYGEYNENIQKNTHIWTHLDLANAEASIGKFDMANEQINNAQKIVNTMMPGPGTDSLKNQISNIRTNLNRIIN